jgi:two-component system OmpR family sensor kinase
VLRDWRARGVHATVLDQRGRALSDAPIRLGGDDPDERENSRSSRGSLDSAAVAFVKANQTEGAFTVDGPRGGIRVLGRRLHLGGGRYTAVITQSLSEVNELLEQAQAAALVSVPVLLLLAIAGGYLLARRGLAPVAAMNEQAQRIDARNLHERLAVADPRDELGQLATTFNALLERVDRAFEQQRRFTADASHELRTPVAIVRGEADVALSSGRRTVEEYREALRIVRDGSERLSRIVNDLFLLARADAGQIPIRAAPLYLDELLAEVARSVRSLAQRAGIDIRVTAPEEIAYVGDEELLRRLLLNLLDNAIKYSTRPGVVALTLESAAGWRRVTVTDSGAGIPPEAQPHVFERFYRGDMARSVAESAQGGGAGLGLSIARWIAERHGGGLTLVESSPNGTTFELVLPTTVDAGAGVVDEPVVPVGA